MWYVQKNIGMCPRDPNAKCHMLKTLISQTDFIILYPASDSGLLINSLFNFQGNVVKINCI
jgi:hypothetical protein